MSTPATHNPNTTNPRAFLPHPPRLTKEQAFETRAGRFPGSPLEKAMENDTPIDRSKNYFYELRIQEEA